MPNGVMISVIVPVYNAADFLERALDSLCAQAMQAVEFICVDDGSEDSSFALLKKYAEKDIRFRVFTKQNEGVSLTRNFGIEQARGTYIMFLDADDWYEENTCQKAFQLVSQGDKDIGLFCMNMEYIASSKYCDILPTQDAEFDEAGCRKLLRQSVGLIGQECQRIMKLDYLSLVYLKIFRRSIVEQYHIRFADIRQIGSFEDGLFCIEYLKHVKSAGFSPEVLYHYNKINGASITTRYREKLPKQWERLFACIEAHFPDEQRDEFEHALRNRKAYAMLTLGLNLMSGQIPLGEKLKSWKALLQNPQLFQTFSFSEIKTMPKSVGLYFSLIRLKCVYIPFILLGVMQKIRMRKRT